MHIVATKTDVGDEMNDLVSIIVPVFNTGKLLFDTVQSILSQTYQNIEIILIDDGSNDQTRAICDQLSSSNEKIRCIHKENGGICSARNAGMKTARGQYIAFCDHDDKMMPNCIEVAMKATQSNNADVVRFRRIQQFVDDKKTESSSYKEFEPYQYTNRSWDNYYKTTKCCGYGVWAGIYKKEFLSENNIFFDESVKYGYEDHIFVSSCLASAAKMSVIADILYYWIQRKGKSTSTKTGESIIANRIYALEKWASIEEGLMNEFNASNKDRLQSSYSYMDFVMNELRYAGLTKKEEKSILDKELLKFQCKKYFSESDHRDKRLMVKCTLINGGAMGLYFAMTDQLKKKARI